MILLSGYAKNCKCGAERPPPLLPLVGLKSYINYFTMREPITQCQALTYVFKDLVCSCSGWY